MSILPREIFTTANQAFQYLFEFIMKNGSYTKIGTKAIYNTRITILNPRQNEISVPWRKWSKKYAEREWDWYLSKNRSVEELKKHAHIWDKMHKGDNIVNSNYGWQWSRNNQLEKIIDLLRKDKYTRRAYVTIYDGKEVDDYELDTPCTLNIGFRYNPNTDALDMTVIMRSNDLVYGFCNDTYCFSKLLIYVADRKSVV